MTFISRLLFSLLVMELFSPIFDSNVILLLTLVYSCFLESLGVLIPVLFPLRLLNPKAIVLRQRIKNLRIKAEEVNSMATFVQHSKLQREINSLVKEEQSVPLYLDKVPAFHQIANQAFPILKYSCYIGLAAFYYNHAVFIFHDPDAYYFSWIPGFSSLSTGNFGIVTWLVICRHVGSSFAASLNKFY